MFTGFLLRGDADAKQAREIFESLAREVPGIGALISYFILGKSGSWQIVYVNHIATFTIIVVYIIFEHSRKIWPDVRSLVWSVLLVTVLGFFVSASLHDGFHPTVKGPWYFLGLQDLLHWLSHPAWALFIVFVVLVLIYMAGSKNSKVFFPARRSLLVIMGLYALLTIDGMFFRGENWRQVFPADKDYHERVFGGHFFNRIGFGNEGNIGKMTDTPLINGRPESCMLCHSDAQGFSSSHDPSATGCYACHGGNPFAVEKEIAHKNMVLIPGNLSNADRSCGNVACHPAITERIHTGLMAALTGMINVDRYVFGEQKSPDGKATIADLHHSAADEHLKNLCVRCHLGNDKIETGPVTEESRGGGCLACHLNYDDKALMALRKHQADRSDTSYLVFHPSVDLNVTNDHCFGCHSRSGRISANYEGWHETQFTLQGVAGKEGFRVVENSRVFTYVKDDVHHAAGLECVDCHTSYELMGDGNHYQHQEKQQDVSCEDCHANHPKTVKAGNLDGESAIIASLRFGNLSDKDFVLTGKHQRPLINVFKEGDSLVLLEKNSKKKHVVKPFSSLCQKDKVHHNVSCSACHTSWAPTCIGCHNAYDPNEPGYDMVMNKEQRGSWVEYVGSYEALPPTLGVRKENGKEEVIPVIPGMILTIDVGSFDKRLHDSLIFRRLYAPAAPHTTAKVGRSCESCHNDPLALGYGKGKLDYEIREGKGYWHFEPEYGANKNDGLPEDAWIPFLGTRKGEVSTRSDVFPFTIEEQKRMLTAGACLTCHQGDSKVMKSALEDFGKVLENRSDKCVLPAW